MQQAPDLRRSFRLTRSAVALADALGVPTSDRDVLVDVVVPTYGPCPYLEEAVRSVVAQTYRCWRLTIVDNSPESGAAEAVHRAFRDDPRVRYLATGGLDQADNWNAAMRSGDAPLVGMLHDDDLWDPEFLERRVDVLQRHPACAFVFSGYRWIDEEGDLVSLRPLRVAPGLLQPEAFVPVEYVANLMAPGVVLYRRAALEAEGTGFTAATVYPDYEYWLRLGCRSPVYAIDVIDNANRLHGGSVTSASVTPARRRTGEQWLQFIDVVEPVIDEALPGVLPTAVRRRRRAGAHLTSALDSLQAGDRAATARSLRAALRCRRQSALDVRVPPIMVMLLIGPWASERLGRLRVAQHRWRLPVHVGDVVTLLRDRWRLRHLPAGTSSADLVPEAGGAAQP